MDFLSAGWIWLYVGALLMLAEILTPGFVVFFFGLAAASVGALVLLLPESLHPSLNWQLGLFSILSVVYLVTLRRYVKSVFMGDTAESKVIESPYMGRIGKVVAPIRAEVPGRIVLGDSEWAASADRPISEGVEVRVVEQKNLTLKVETI